jgi:hypothetical protein
MADNSRGWDDEYERRRWQPDEEGMEDQSDFARGQRQAEGGREDWAPSRGGRSDFARGQREFGRREPEARGPDFARGMRRRGAPAERRPDSEGADYARGQHAFERGQEGQYGWDDRPGYGRPGDPWLGEERGWAGERQAPLGGTPWRNPGPYQGVGPRGYQRSDERIREDICERLTWHGQLDASDVELDVNSGEVTLRGTVDSRWAKREAEDLADSVAGVREVHNQLRVKDQRAGMGGQ